ARTRAAARAIRRALPPRAGLRLADAPLPRGPGRGGRGRGPGGVHGRPPTLGRLGSRSLASLVAVWDRASRGRSPATQRLASPTTGPRRAEPRADPRVRRASRQPSRARAAPARAGADG